MDDEGIGIAGWLFADLMLVLALVFVVVGRGDADDAKANLAKERAAHAETRDTLDKERTAHAETQDALDEARAAAAAAQGALDEARAVAGETQDALDEALAVAERTQDALDKEREAHHETRECLYELDPKFLFDQIVLRDMVLGSVTTQDIWNGYARENVEKSNEGSRLVVPLYALGRARTFLDKRFLEGSRIALVETYSYANINNFPGVRLSQEVNAVLFATLGDHYFTDNDRKGVQNHRTGAYLWRSFEPGEVRINLFFVKPPGEHCEQR